MSDTPSYHQEHYASMLSHINANSERHPWYGPCDAMGNGGSCFECNRIIALIPSLERERDAYAVTLRLIATANARTHHRAAFTDLIRERHPELAQEASQP